MKFTEVCFESDHDEEYTMVYMEHDIENATNPISECTKKIGNCEDMLKRALSLINEPDIQVISIKDKYGDLICIKENL